MKALYLYDSYLKECKSSVLEIRNEGTQIFLDQTVLYARGGGQPTDFGKLVRASDNAEFSVVNVTKVDGKISHEVDKPGLVTGDAVRVLVNWDRRYKLMKMHTAAHTLASIMHKEKGVLITGNQIEEDKTRFDFNLETFNLDEMQLLVQKANQALNRNLDVKTYFLPREEAMKIPGVVKLAGALPPEITELRIVEIGDVDLQADGGTHVRNTSEVGEIELIKLENKGKSNKRLYFKLK
ncbi:alanyl-tRNA editing protein [Candidatus Micrarchaeota archaeon]|nr:alanyl-tRNA editing protein [Candidatus Micrarchaeota archaeon]